MSHRAARLGEAAGIFALPSLMLALMGAPSWTEPTTPDAEFALTLAANAEGVLEHVPAPSYFWTRLGMIVPVRGLTTLMPAPAAMEAIRGVMLGCMALAVYLLVSRLIGRPAAVVATGLISFNTMVLGALGDPYPVRVALPMLAVAIAGFAASAVAPGSSTWPIVAGAAAGVAVMAHQFALPLVVVGAIVTLAMLMHDPISRGRIGRFLGLTAIAFVAAVGALLLAGIWVFPGRNWLDTTLSTLRSADASAFTSPDHGWLAADPALLVPVALLVATFPRAWRDTARAPVHRALTAAWFTGVGITAVMTLSASLGSNVLEFQAYVVFLWPAPLICLAIVLGVLIPSRGPWRWGSVVGAVVALLVVGATWRLLFTTVQGLLIVVPFVVVLLVAARRGPIRPWAACMVVGVSAVVPQVLQNATDPLGDPFLARKANWAALAGGLDYGADARAALANADWVFARLQPGERIVPWLAGGSDLGSAMFVLYPGFIGTDLRPDEQSYFRGLAPSAVVMLGHSQGEVDAIRAAARAAGADLLPGACRSWVAPRSSSPAITCLDRVRFRS